MRKSYSVKLFILLSILLFSSCGDSSNDLFSPCSGNPCEKSLIPNKTICIEKAGTYSCTCETGYELKDDGTCLRVNNNTPCKDNPCKEENKGTCVVAGNTYQCYCDTGYFVRDGRCELDLNTLCENFSCPENSECKVVAETASCSCYIGYKDFEGHCVLSCEDGFVLNETKDKCILDCANITNSFVNEDNNKCICEQNFHVEDNACILNTKKINCKLDNPEKPEHSKEIVEEVDVLWNYNTNSWNEASYCLWECSENYHGDYCNQCDQDYLMLEGSCVFDCSGDSNSTVNAANNSCICIEGFQLDQGVCRELVSSCTPNPCLEFESINKTNCVANSLFDVDFTCKCSNGYEENEEGVCVEIYLSEGCFLDIYSNVITRNLKDLELINELHRITSGHNSLGYDGAKIKMFGYVDNFENKVLGVYTGQFYYLNHGEMPNQNQFNCEHTWPQSKFGRGEPMRSDLHHLFPTYSTVNSSRGSLAFGYIENRDNEYGCNLGTNPDCLYSDYNSYISFRETGVKFEVADPHKGNTARAMFYFAIRYGSMNDISEGFFSEQKRDLYQWNLSDPVDDF